MSCKWCDKKAGSMCSKCKMVYYCCRDHQMADFQDHKFLCNSLKKALNKMEREERKLHENQGDDIFMSGDPFVNHVGHFWGIHETRPYMRARCGVIKALDSLGTRISLEAAIDHILGCLTLCPTDKMGVRDFAPAMMLRIGQDQECYDFIKW